MKPILNAIAKCLAFVYVAVISIIFAPLIGAIWLADDEGDWGK